MQPIRIIGLCGHARSGKDTIGDYLRDKHDFITMSFAYPLKAIVDYIIDPDAIVEGLDDLIDSYYINYKKGLCLKKDFTEWKELVNDRNVSLDSDKADKRFLLQIIGTEYMRAYNSSIWVDSLNYRIMTLINPKKQLNIAVTDVRFINEADWIHSLDGIIIRTIRDNNQPHINLLLTTHKSEIELEQIRPDFTIEANSGEIDKLYSETEKIVAILSSCLSKPPSIV